MSSASIVFADNIPCGKMQECSLLILTYCVKFGVLRLQTLRLECKASIRCQHMHQLFFLKSKIEYLCKMSR
jgi:hypothetical protein